MSSQYLKLQGKAEDQPSDNDNLLRALSFASNVKSALAGLDYSLLALDIYSTVSFDKLELCHWV